MSSNDQESLRLCIRGLVQGVGFRPFLFRLAQTHGLRGWVQNAGEGVKAEVNGDRQALKAFIRSIHRDKPAGARIEDMRIDGGESLELPPFHIKESQTSGVTTSIPLDRATCADCLHELLSPGNRRFRYPFITCAVCGPRFTVLHALPFDRTRTSLRAFPLCPACEKEFHDPDDRRFHAQTLTCPVCGPTLTLTEKNGVQVADSFAALQEAARLLAAGAILAVKGLGGYHIAVNARDEEAVRRLRQRKHRPEKPFAIMFPDRHVLQHFALPTGLEMEWLSGPVAPIVLVEPGNVQTLAPGVSAEAPLLGAMLPHTPLHHLLLREFGGPLVMTSGNPATGPIITDNGAALQHLGPLVDAFLMHNRDIIHHADDSILRIRDEGPTVMRLGRGLAPLKIPVSMDMRGAVALGGHLKNSFAIGQEDGILVSQEMGQLDVWDNQQRLEREVHACLDLLQIKPRLVLHDCHPAYGSTALAHAQEQPCEEIQHHAAHVMAAAIERGLMGEALALAWDGWGLGEDGTLWGGEFYRVAIGGGKDALQHLGSFQPFPIVGGDQAAREPRRAAWGVAKALFGSQAEAQIRAHRADACLGDGKLAKLVLAGTHPANTVVTSSVGRLFDAVTSLLNVKHVCTFEGQAAMLLEGRARRSQLYQPYAALIQKKEGHYEVDWRPGLRELLAEHARGQPGEVMAARFHHMLVDIVEQWVSLTGMRQVLVSGGVFQNHYLLQVLFHRLHKRGIHLLVPQRLPVHDGGLAVGQLMNAFAIRSPGYVSRHSRPHSFD